MKKLSISKHGIFFTLFFCVFMFFFWRFIMLLTPVKNYGTLQLADDVVFFLFITVLSSGIISLMHRQVSQWTTKIWYLRYQAFSCSHFFVAALVAFMVRLIWTYPPLVAVLIVVIMLNSFLVFLLNKKNEDDQKPEGDDGDNKILTFPLPDTPVDENGKLGEFNQALAKTIFTTIEGYNDDTYLSLALNGKWGSGKTSVIKGVEKLLGKEYQVININFWKQKQAGDVVMELERQIEEFFSEVYFGWRFKELEFFKLAAGLYSAHANTLFSLFENISSNNSMLSAKKQLGKKIAEALALTGKKRIVVIFDDIDRVFDKNDLLFFLKAIVYLVGFEKVVSLTAVDCDKIEHVINLTRTTKMYDYFAEKNSLITNPDGSENVEVEYLPCEYVDVKNGHEFLYKIFNCTVDMEVVEPERIKKIEKDFLDKLLTNFKINEKEAIIRDVVKLDEKLLNTLIHDYRENIVCMNNFITKLMMLNNCGGQSIVMNISPVYVFLMSVLKSQNSKLYYDIKKISETQHVIGNARTIYQLIQQTYYDAEGNPKQVDINKIYDLLKYLFTDDNDDNLVILGIPVKLKPANPSVCYYYYNLCLPSIDTSNDVIADLVERIINNERCIADTVEKYGDDKRMPVIKNLINSLNVSIKLKQSDLVKIGFSVISEIIEIIQKPESSKEDKSELVKAALGLFNGFLEIDKTTNDQHNKYRNFNAEMKIENRIGYLVKLFMISPISFKQDFANINYYNLLYFYLNPFHAHTFGAPTLAEYNPNLTQIAGALKSYYLDKTANQTEALAAASFCFWIINERLRKSNMGTYLLSKEERENNRTFTPDEFVEMYREMLKLFMTEALSFMQTVISTSFIPQDNEGENKPFYKTCDEALANLFNHSHLVDSSFFEQENQKLICDFIKLLMKAYLMPETVKTIGVYGKHFENKLKNTAVQLPEQITGLDEYVEIFNLYLQKNPAAGKGESILYTTGEKPTYQEALTTLNKVNEEIKRRTKYSPTLQ